MVWVKAFKKNLGRPYFTVYGLKSTVLHCRFLMPGNSQFFFWFTYNEFDRSLHLMCRWEVVNIWSARFQSFGLGFRHGYLWGVADLIIELVYISWMTIWRPSLHALDSTIHPCIVICHSKVPLDIPGIDRKYIFINFAGGWVTRSSKEL